MGHISSFTVTVVCIIILSFILRAVMPRSSIAKYADFVIGMIVAITLAGSFVNTDTAGIAEIITAGAENAFSKEASSKIYNEAVAEKFTESVRRQVCGVIREKFGCECEADVMTDIDTSGSVKGISGIYIKLYGVCDADDVTDTVSQKFGVMKEDVHIGEINVGGKDND